MTQKSKGYKKRYMIFQIASISLLIFPLGIFTVLGFIRGTDTQKLSLGVGFVLSLLFTGANLIFKFAPRSAIWILIMALVLSLDKVQSVICVTGTCVMLEECVTSRLEKYYKSKYKINKEIDIRFEEQKKEKKERENGGAEESDQNQT